MEKIVIIKIGGRAFENEEVFRELALAFKAHPQYEFVVVHGGGAEISQALAVANRTPEFIDGLRITTAEDIEIVEQVLSETINSRIADYFKKYNVQNMRMSGKTNGLFMVEPLRKNGRDMGFVGDIKAVNTFPVMNAVMEGRVPIISPISADQSLRSFNVNADSAAAALAAAIRCHLLIYFTDVPGVMHNNSTVKCLTVQEAKDLIDSGVIKGGMIAKLESVFEVIKSGVDQVFIGKWQNQDTLKNILLNQFELGTIIKS